MTTNTPSTRSSNISLPLCIEILSVFILCFRTQQLTKKRGKPPFQVKITTGNDYVGEEGVIIHASNNLLSYSYAKSMCSEQLREIGND